MDISFVKFTNRNDKLFYVTGGYGPQYSVNVGVELFRKTLQNLKKKNIAIPLSDEEMKAFAEQDEVNEKLQEEQNLKRQEYAKYEETGRINLEKKNYNEAIADFNKVLEIDPNNKIAYFNRARAKSGLGDSKGSIEDNNKVIELDPSYSMAYNNRGWDNFLLKNYIEALKDFNNAIELEPRNAVAYDSRQETKFALNDFAGCMEDCNMAISLNPKLANSYFFRGKVYFKNGDKTKACENWSKAGQYGTMEAYELIKQNCN
jgi:tetratricopeptide (TPR) repeat protein